MAGTRPDLPALKRALKAAESDPVAFAYWSAGGEKNGNLLVDQKKKASALHREAKALAKGAQVASGIIRAEGRSLTLLPDHDAPKLEAGFRQTLKAIGVDFKVSVGQAHADDPAPAASVPESGAAETHEPRPLNPEKTAQLSQAAERWEAGRSAAFADLKALISAIDTLARTEPALAEATEGAQKLSAHFAPLDQTLSSALRRIAATSDPKERGALEEAARKRARALRTHIDTPFFVAVDANGFVPTKIRPELSASLDAVDKALGS